MRGINFYWRIVVMSNYYGNATDLTRCIEEKLRNFLGYSIGSSYPDREDEFDVAHEYAEGQCRMELGLGPRNPSAIHKKRSRLSPWQTYEMNKYMGTLRDAELARYPAKYANGEDPTLPPLVAKRPKKELKESRYNGAPLPAFSLLDGGRSRRTRRRRTTKKQTRKQKRRV